MLSRRGFLCGCCGLAAWGFVGGGLTARAAAPANPEDARLAAFLDKAYGDAVARRPEWRTWLGLPGDHSGWDDNSEAALAEEERIRADTLARLRAGFDPARLSDEGRLTFRLWEYASAQQAEAYRWRLNSYPADHFNGRHGALVDMLSSTHAVRDLKGAEDWIARARTIAMPVDQLVQALELRAARGVVPPRFSVAKSLEATRSVLVGAPFEAGAAQDGELLAGFKRRVAALPLPDERKRALEAEATAALRDRFGPAYRSLAAALETLHGRATDDDGVWKLPDGLAYYRNRLAEHTTLDMDPDAVHALGLKEVARIQGEMRGIMGRVGFQGDLQAFFRHLREEDRFYFPDTDAGRKAYVDGATKILADIGPVLAGQFGRSPKAPLVVERFPLFREASETIARYGQPATDGSRPGIYNVNLSRMREMPIWQMEVLAFHEGVPGHHMQIALAQEMTHLPTFRRYDSHTAYVEGWGLYSERLPKELGFYTDPYSDFGRLTFELWRAIRLVVDTGIHAQRWTRARSIDYFVANSAFTPEVAEREVDRYIVYPGQACAYHVGLLKILELRDKARAELGPKFDVRGFHDAILANGSVPLAVLEEVVGRWVQKAA